MGGAHRLGQPVMRRGLVLAGAAALLAVGCGLIVAGGDAIRAREPSITTEDLTAAVEAAGWDETGEPAAPEAAGSASRQDAAGAREGADRPDLAEDAAPSAGADQMGLERLAPREALSELGQALPPRPKAPGEWKGTRLAQPVATAAGLVEAKGYRVAVAGVDPVPAEEMCSYQGRDWPCGVRARAAFRAFLRGRAITCVVPPEAERDIVTAGCMVGKQDIAAWLVGNGWAPARADGDYASLGDEARAAGRGIFGPPPATTAPSSIVGDSELPAPPPGGGSILAVPPAGDVAPDAPPPAASVIAPGEVFPPVPPPAPAQ
ncbi:MAG: thermonuclease family protein [Rhizobiaceae bacterium]|nr:thermonuclease family protein [Rhizobiaceae bacterium]